jgi:hypothetical protein
MSSFNSVNDLGSSVQANVSYSVGLFNKTWAELLARLVNMFIIYFNSVLQISIDKRLNNSLEFRGILASFLLGILLFFPSIRTQFTNYIRNRSGVDLPWFVALIYNFTGSYTYSKFTNIFSFLQPKIDATKLILALLLALKSYISDKFLCTNFILGNRYLHDTLLLIDVLVEIFSDPSFSWIEPELLFDILVDTPTFLWAQLGLKIENVIGKLSIQNLSIYAMTFFEGIVFYKSDLNSDIHLFLFCIVFELHSTVCIKLSYVMRCLSPWDARLKPNFDWDVYWRSLVAYCLTGTTDFTHVGIKVITNTAKFDDIITKALSEADSILIPSDEQIELEYGDDESPKDADSK